MFISDGSFLPRFDESVNMDWIAQGPGSPGVSPLSNITVGLRTGTNIAATRYNMSHRIYDSFSDTSPPTAWQDHPNSSNSRLTHYNGAAMDYWITCNGRRFIWAARLNSGVWQTGYMGFFLPWAGDVSYPYPICCGGCSNQAAFNSSETSDRRHSAWFDPIGDLTGGANTSFIVREPSALYRAYQNGVDNGGVDDYSDGDILNTIWPWQSASQDEPDIYRRQIERMSRTIRYQLGTSPDPELRGYLPRQAILFSQSFAGGANQTLGMLDGVFQISNEGGAAGGDTFSFESPEVTYLLVQNTFRADRDNFAAIRMDPD